MYCIASSYILNDAQNTLQGLVDGVVTHHEFYSYKIFLNLVTFKKQKLSLLSLAGQAPL